MRDFEISDTEDCRRRFPRNPLERKARFPAKWAQDLENSSTLADFSLPIACPDLDYFRFADNSVLFVGATNLIPPVSTSSLAACRHNRKNQLDR